MTFLERFLNVNKKDRVFGLDLLRSIAIILVLILHSEFIIRKLYPDFHVVFVDGVDLFFVLSGFLIGGILIKEFNEQNKFNFLKFWSKRWLRTLPNYYLLLSVISVLYFSNPDIYFNWKYLFFLQNFNIPNPRFFPESWSLCIEEWFYIISPILIFIFFKILKNKKVSILSSIFFLVIFSLGYRYYKSFQFEYVEINYDMYFRKIVLARLDGLALGVFAAYLNYYYKLTFDSNKKIKLFLALILIVIYTQIPFSQFHFIFSSSLLSLAVFLSLPFLLALKEYPNYLGSLILYISVISYSLYIIHFTLVMWNIIDISEYQSFSQMSLNYIGYFIITFIISTINFKYFESYFLTVKSKISD